MLLSIRNPGVKNKNSNALREINIPQRFKLPPLRNSRKHKQRHRHCVTLLNTRRPRRRYLGLLYSEYLCATVRTDTLCRWPAVLECNTTRVSYLHLFPTLHTISCRHHTLLLISLRYILLLQAQSFVNTFGAPQTKIMYF